MLWFLTVLSACSGAALSAAVSSSLSQNIATVVGQGGAAPLTSLQIHFIQNMIHETLEDFRSVSVSCLHLFTSENNKWSWCFSPSSETPVTETSSTFRWRWFDSFTSSWYEPTQHVDLKHYAVKDDPLTCCFFQNEIHSLIEKYSVNESLVEEIEKLKEENRRLKTNYWSRTAE